MDRTGARVELTKLRGEAIRNVANGAINRAKPDGLSLIPAFDNQGNLHGTVLCVATNSQED